MHQLQNKDIGMGYGTLVSLVFHNLPSLYPSSFCRNDFLYLFEIDKEKVCETKSYVFSEVPYPHFYRSS